MNPDHSRRQFLKLAVITLPISQMLGMSMPSRNAWAGTASKSDFHYQDHPNEGKQCSNCTAYKAPPAGEPSGTCSIVSGAISPNGWCMAFSSK